MVGSKFGHQIIKEKKRMPSMGIFDRTVGLLQKVLDLRIQNQQVIASNIANADTPGYAPAHLEFERDLEQAVNDSEKRPAVTHSAHFPIGAGGMDAVQAKVMRTPDSLGIGDGNGVSVDQEMVALAENQILYEAATQMLNKKLGLLKYVAQDGR
jgi:flagellar basal-body rod protein FlgB